MEAETGIQKWHELDGDNTLALDWPLTEDSHVWEIGGFEGRWAQQIWDKFHCHITIFEPQLWAMEKMRKRFEGIEKIDIRPYGLWVEEKTMLLGGFETDGASIFGSPENRTRIGYGEFKDYFTILFRETKYKIDVGLMNIEGAEYTLIPEFIRSGVINKFDNFWCQFHPGLVENGDEKSEDIFEGMERTHRLLWNCFPTAVAWRKR